MSKQFKITISVLASLVIVLVFIGAWLWYAQSKIYVKMGFAEDKFPYKMYSVEEMGKMYKQEPLEGVVTTQTPEQTHAQFIAALKKGDIDGAVECCVVKSSQEKMKEKLNRIKENDNFMLMIKDIEKIEEEKNSIDNANSVYLFQSTVNKEIYNNSMVFQKNLQGVWLIESF